MPGRHGACSSMTARPSLHAASLLLEREGLTVAGVASSIAGALRQARALRRDLILVDIGLGDESGFELARLLARTPRRSRAQAGAADVILISAAAQTDYQGPDQDSPAAGFLTTSASPPRGHQPHPRPHPPRPAP